MLSGTRSGTRRPAVWSCGATTLLSCREGHGAPLTADDVSLCASGSRASAGGGRKDRSRTQAVLCSITVPATDIQKGELSKSVNP
jgi:hypothetical protein